MNTMAVDVEVRRRLDMLVADLWNAGALRSPRWADAFAAVPRHVFVPRLLTSGVDARGITVWRPLDSGNHETWLDGIIATCSVPAVPRAWLEQARPGGVILADITSRIEGGLARLTVAEGRRAEGHFTKATGRFMAARSDQHTYTPRDRPTYAPTAGNRDTPVGAGDIRGHYAFRLLLGACLPGIELVYHHDEHTETMAVQLQRPDGSAWARTPLPDQVGEGTITWGGDHDLWHRVENAWRWWADRDRPDHTQFGVTADVYSTGMWWQPTGGERISMSALPV